jgi:uncharacterized membrane protein
MAENNTYSGKTISIISYLWIIGWLIALLMHNNNRTSLGIFHLRQSLGLLIFGVLVWILMLLIGIVGIPIIGWMLYLGLFVLWLLGFLSALQGEQKPIPLVGEHFQVWLKGIG